MNIYEYFRFCTSTIVTSAGPKIGRRITTVETDTPLISIVSRRISMTGAYGCLYYVKDTLGVYINVGYGKWPMTGAVWKIV